jgi:oligopeptide transport system substrate-binding protein
MGLCAGCGGERPADSARRAGMLLLGNGPEPESLDPHRSTSLPAFSVQMALFEGLVTPHPATMEPMPGVAERWEISEDGRQYRFYLRNTARWSDGAPVTADDFVAAWCRALDPAGGSAYAAMLYSIEGAEVYHRGTGPLENLAVRAVSDDLLEIRLRQPTPYFLHLLMHPVCFPMPAHLRSVFPFSEQAVEWKAGDPFVGNGPFVLSAWRPGQVLEVEASSTYWDAEAVRLKRIHFMVIDEPGAEERAFLAGQLHVTDALPPARVEHYRASAEPAFRSDPFLATYYILPNHRRQPLSDQRVRAALSLSIDRESLVRHLLSGGERAADQFVPDTMPGYAGPGGGGEFDPDRARALLAEAGFPDGRGFPVLRYLYNSSESHRRIAEALQAMWQSELNVSIELVNQEWRTYLQSRENGAFDLARAVWIGDYPEPSSFLQLWESSHANNWTGWADPAYDTSMREAMGLADAADRSRVYALAERRLMEEAVILPLYFYVTNYLKDPALRGWYPTLLDWHPYKFLYFAE